MSFESEKKSTISLCKIANVFEGKEKAVAFVQQKCAVNRLCDLKVLSVKKKNTYTFMYMQVYANIYPETH
jgi:hypothetical protein